MVDFAQLRSLSGKSGLDKLHSELSKISGDKTSRKDEDFWKPTVDKAGNGMAVIRFLPAPQGEDVPFVRLFDHGFQGPTGLWYIENSLTTLGKQDPVSEYNSKLWNSTTSDDAPERKQARKQKRRLHYIVNILVEQDAGNPSSEGKVFKYKIGKKIFDKLNEAMNPQFADEEPMNPFDMWTGASFKLKIRNVEGYRNYDKSEFNKPELLFGDNDEKKKEVWEQCKSLQMHLDASNFKTYDELRNHLMKVLDTNTPTMPRAEQLEETPAPKAKATKAKAAEASPFKDDDDDDDTLEFFNKLGE